MVNELVTNSATYDDILSNVNFYVMASINPDGYAYTFTDVSTSSFLGGLCHFVGPLLL